MTQERSRRVEAQRRPGTALRLLHRVLAKAAGSQRGFMLVEAAVAIGIVGTATLTTLGFISAAANAETHNSIETTAAWVAASQAEYVGQAPFVPTSGQYAAVPAPSGFAVANSTAAYPGGDGAIQAVTIVVSYQGSEVLSTEIVKVNR